MSTSVLVLDGWLRVIHCLGHLPKLKIHVLSRHPTWNSTWSKYSRHVSSFHTSDEVDDQVFLADVIQLVEQTKAEVLLPVSTEATLFVAKHRAELSTSCSLVPTPPPSIIEMANNKARLGHFMQANDIPTPATWYPPLHPPIDGGELPYPLLLKYTDSGFGKGVFRFDDQESLLQFIQTTPGLMASDAPVLLQSYMEGEDIDCSVLCEQGTIWAYTIQRPLLAPNKPFRPAFALQFEHHDAVLKIATQLMQALNWSGIAHIDMRLDALSGTPHVLEINPRYWRTLLGSLKAGVNFPFLSLRMAAGDPLPPPGFSPARYLSHDLRYSKYQHRVMPRFRWKDTDWPYVLADPLPIVIDRLRKRS